MDKLDTVTLLDPRSISRSDKLGRRRRRLLVLPSLPSGLTRTLNSPLTLKNSLSTLVINIIDPSRRQATTPNGAIKVSQLTPHPPPIKPPPIFETPPTSSPLPSPLLTEGWDPPRPRLFDHRPRLRRSARSARSTVILSRHRRRRLAPSTHRRLPSPSTTTLINGSRSSLEKEKSSQQPSLNTTSSNRIRLQPCRRRSPPTTPTQASLEPLQQPPPPPTPLTEPLPLPSPPLSRPTPPTRPLRRRRSRSQGVELVRPPKSRRDKPTPLKLPRRNTLTRITLERGALHPLRRSLPLELLRNPLQRSRRESPSSDPKPSPPSRISEPTVSRRSRSTAAIRSSQVPRERRSSR